MSALNHQRELIRSMKPQSRIACCLLVVARGQGGHIITIRSS